MGQQGAHHSWATELMAKSWILEETHSINRDKMFDVLLAYRMPPQIVEGFKGLYLDTMAQVVTKDGSIIFFQFLLEFYEVTHCCHTYLSSS